jgi:hypothetical protein
MQGEIARIRCLSGFVVHELGRDAEILTLRDLIEPAEDQWEQTHRGVEPRRLAA